MKTSAPPLEPVAALPRRDDAGHSRRLQILALDAAADAIVITDRGGIIEWVNAAFSSLTGYSRDEAIGRTLRDLLRSGQHPPEFFKGLWSTILAGNVWRGEVTNRRKDGSLFAELLTITPLREASAEITHFVAFKQDVSERRHLEAQLRRAQRLESVGLLAGGVAHDLNNILAPVMMAASLLRAATLSEAERRLLDMVEASSRRGAAIVRQLLMFGRGLEGTRAPVGLKMIVAEMLAMIRETFPKNIAVRRESTDKPDVVDGDATQLHQVLMNLCINARDAMPQGGELTIGLDGLNLDEEYVRHNPEAAVGSFVVLTVADTGTGIAPEHLDHIFDPFFTTKQVGNGTGLGLSTTLGIVKGHGGFIQVLTKPGTGTSIKVFLPARPASHPPMAVVADQPPPRGGGELLLIIDDEAFVRATLQHTLENAGYRVVAAANGSEGLERFEDAEDEIKLVLTDLLMGGVDGAVVVDTLRARGCGLPIIAISGAWQSVKLNELKKLGVSIFLNKPFGPEVLLRAVADSLARRTGRPVPAE